MQGKPEHEEPKEEDPKLMYKEDVLRYNKEQKNVIGKKKGQFFVKEIEKSSNFDMSQVVDLFNEDEMIEEINPESLVIEDTEEEKKEKEKKKKTLPKLKQRTQEEEDQFAKDYKKMGGIQHIICSATMTIDNTGRITPKKAKKLKKQGV